MKKRNYIGIIVGLVLLLTSFTLVHKNNDSSLNPFPMTLSESVAEAVSPSGQGIFVIGGNAAACATTITNPVIGGTWCFSAGPPANISIYTSMGFEPYIPSNQPADFGYDFIGTPTSSTTIKYVILRTFTVPANFAASGNAAASLCSASVAATGSAVFNIQHNGLTVATATFAPSSTVCTFSTQASFSLIAGDTLSVVAPTSPDATLSDISITLGTIRN
jgi:hypothetical protein